MTISNNGSHDPVFSAAPLVPVAVGLVLGIVLDRYVQASAACYAAAFCVVLIPALVRPIRLLGAPWIVLIAACSLGALLHLQATRTTPPSSIERYAMDGRQIARVSGTVASEPRVLARPQNPFALWTFGQQRTLFLLDTQTIDTSDGKAPVVGRLRVTVREPILDIRPHERVEIFGWLYPYRAPDNPGGFDWAAYHRRSGILAGFVCNHRENVRRLDPGRPRRPSWTARLRAGARAMLTGELTTGAAEEANLLEAMLLGHRSQLDRRLNDLFIRAGCIHFLAVSGTHMVIVLSFIWIMGRFLGRSQRQCACFVMGAAIIYALVAEPRPPILRATVMTVLFCISLLVGRPRAPLNWMAAAAILLVLANPLTLFDIGFQFSFAAVLGVAYLTPALVNAARAGYMAFRRRSIVSPDGSEGPSGTQVGDWAGEMAARPSGLLLGLRRTGRIVGLAAAIAIAAWLAGAPLTATHFQRVQPWGPANSVVLLPFVYVTMIGGLVRMALAALLPTAGTLLLGPLVAVEQVMIRLVEAMSELPGAVLAVAPPPWWVIGTYYVALGAFAVRFRSNRRQSPADAGQASDKGSLRRNRENGLLAIAVLLAVVAAGTWAWSRRATDRLVVTVLAVGAGSAVVMELPDGRAVLCDAGSSGPFDVGRGVVVPFLRHRGISQLDNIYISHPNLDHFSGIPAVLEAVEVRAITVNHYFIPKSKTRSASQHLLDLLADQGRHVLVHDASQCLTPIGDVTVEWLSPEPGLDLGLATNDTSSVMRFTYAGQSILLTGDIEDRTQGRLLEKADLSADVLILPHHGGVRASTADFIDAVDPVVVVRSSGETMAATLNGLQEACGPRRVINTADVGAITVAIDHDGITVSAARTGTLPDNFQQPAAAAAQAR